MRSRHHIDPGRPAFYVLGSAQDGLPVQVRPLLPLFKEAAPSGGFFVFGAALPSHRPRHEQLPVTGLPVDGGRSGFSHDNGRP